MKKVPVVEYDEEGNSTVIGEADVEVEFKDGMIVIKQAMVEVGSELAKRIQSQIKIKPGDFSIDTSTMDPDSPLRTMYIPPEEEIDTPSFDMVDYYQRWDKKPGTFDA